MPKKLFAVIALMLCSTTAATHAASEGGGATAKGSLPKEVIRRVVRTHINEVKECYEAQLTTNKDLAGKVMVRFVINPHGKVTESAIEESSLKNTKVETCITDAIRNWEFPQPAGGKVVVSYPFVLASTEPASSSTDK